MSPDGPGIGKRLFFATLNELFRPPAPEPAKPPTPSVAGILVASVLNQAGLDKQSLITQLNARPGDDAPGEAFQVVGGVLHKHSLNQLGTIVAMAVTEGLSVTPSPIPDEKVEPGLFTKFGKGALNLGKAGIGLGVAKVQGHRKAIAAAATEATQRAKYDAAKAEQKQQMDDALGFKRAMTEEEIRAANAVKEKAQWEATAASQQANAAAYAAIYMKTMAQAANSVNDMRNGGKDENFRPAGGHTGSEDSQSSTQEHRDTGAGFIEGNATDVT